MSDFHRAFREVARLVRPPGMSPEEMDHHADQVLKEAGEVQPDQAIATTADEPSRGDGAPNGFPNGLFPKRDDDDQDQDQGDRREAVRAWERDFRMGFTADMALPPQGPQTVRGIDGTKEGA